MTHEEVVRRLRELEEQSKQQLQRQLTQRDTCPHCGYCPTCGRHNGYWTQPPWYVPYKPWWGTTTDGTGVASWDTTTGREKLTIR